MGKIRRSFTADKKRKVIEYAEKHGNRAAEKEFKVAESNIRFWRKNKAIIEAMPKTLRSLRFSRARHTELEEELKVIVAEHQQKTRKIRTCDIRKWALDLAQNKFGLTSDQFRARPTWVFSFCQRHGIKIGRKKDCLKTKEARRLLALYHENRDHSYYKLSSEQKPEANMNTKPINDELSNHEK